MELPIVEMFIDEDEQYGIQQISFVNEPATKSHFIMMSDQKLWLAREEEQIAFGAVMVPDMRIPRKLEDGSTVEVFFSVDTIKKTRDRFMRLALGNKSNAEHTSFMLDGTYMVETFIKNTEKGILPPPELNHHPDGTWFVGFKMEGREMWEDYVKTGVFQGFSLEGKFSGKPVADPLEEMAEELIQKLNKLTP